MPLKSINQSEWILYFEIFESFSYFCFWEKHFPWPCLKKKVRSWPRKIYLQLRKKKNRKYPRKLDCQKRKKTRVGMWKFMQWCNCFEWLIASLWGQPHGNGNGQRKKLMGRRVVTNEESPEVIRQWQRGG